MDLPTTWICDTCGERIDGHASGGIVWKEREGPRSGLNQGYDFRIVHLGTYGPRAATGGHCWPFGNSSGNEFAYLQTFAGPDGLGSLFARLELGFFFDLKEGAELARRLFIPNYDLARPHFEQYLVDERPHNLRMPWTQYTLQEMVGRYVSGNTRGDASPQT